MTLPRAYGIQPGDDVEFGKITATSDGAAGDDATVGYNATDGLTLRGQGTTGDVTIYNDADQVVGYVPTGTQDWTYSGNLAVSRAAAGVIVLSELRNTDNTNAISHARMDIRTGGSASGDPFLKFTVDSATDWSIGIDNSDGDALVVCMSSSLGTSNALKFDSALDATFLGKLAKTVTNSITAGSTQTQAGATALTTDLNRVTTVTTTGDGVKLPSAAAGLEITIINSGANALQVWPASGDAIDGGAADAVDSNTLAAGSSRKYLAVDATNWYEEA